MYQGKFDSKKKGQQDPGAALENILKERNAAIAAKAARKRSINPAGVDVSPFAAPAKKPAPLVSSEQKAKAVQPEFPEIKKFSDDTAVRPTAKKETQAKSKKEPKEKKRGSRLGTKIFYTFYFVLILVFIGGLLWFMNVTHDWLIQYEKAQPTAKANAVFEQLFSNPNWEELCRRAGVQSAGFETIEQCAAYLQEKAAGKQLTSVETSAGLSGGKKYIIRAGDEKIAAFTLNSSSQTSSMDNIIEMLKNMAKIPDWTMGDVELYFTHDYSIKIRKLENHTAYINGIPLDDSYTIQIAYTKADQSLPENQRVRTSIQEVSGLMSAPNVLVYDQTGSPIAVLYNPDSNMYEEQIDAIAINDEQRNAIFGALEARAGFMINASGSRAALAKYYDTDSQPYKDIISMGSELWMNHDRGHSFESREILGFTRHSENLFSARASLKMLATGNDGTTVTKDMAYSMFFTYKNGKWLCTKMVNEDITLPIGEVRLTFCDARGTVLSSDFYNTTAKVLTLPTIEVPAGKEFLGWATTSTNAEGVTTKTIVFQPDSSNNVYPSGEAGLVPMTLTPVFRDL